MRTRAIQAHPAPAATPVKPAASPGPMTPMQMPAGRQIFGPYPSTPSRALTLPLPQRSSGPSSEMDVLPSPVNSTSTPVSRMLSLPLQPSSPENSLRDTRDMVAEIRRQVALELHLAGWEEVGTDRKGSNSRGSSLHATRQHSSIEASIAAGPRAASPNFSKGSQESIRCEEPVMSSASLAVSPLGSSTLSTRINTVGTASIRSVGASGSANTRSIGAGSFSGSGSQEFLGGSMRSIPGSGPVISLDPRLAGISVAVGEPLSSPGGPQRMMSSPIQSFRAGTPKASLRQECAPLWSPCVPQRMVSSPIQSFRANMTPQAGSRQEPAFSPLAPSRTLAFGATQNVRQVAAPIRAAPLVVSPRSSPVNSTRNSRAGMSNMGLRASNSDPSGWLSPGSEQTSCLPSPKSCLPSPSGMITADEATANEKSCGRIGPDAQSAQLPSTPAQLSLASPHDQLQFRSARASGRHLEVGIRSSLKAQVQKQFTWDNIEVSRGSTRSEQLSRGSGRSEQGVFDIVTESLSGFNPSPVGTSSASTATGRFTSSTRTQSSLEEEGARTSEQEAHKILVASVCSDKKSEDARRASSPLHQDANRALEDLGRAVPELRYGSVSEVDRVFIQTLRQGYKGPKGRRPNSRRNTIDRSRSGGGSPIGSSASSPRHTNGPRTDSKSRPTRQSSAGQNLRGRAESRDSLSPTNSVSSSKSRPTSFRSRTQTWG